MVRELLRGAVTSALWLEPYPTRLPRLSDLRRPSEGGLAALGTKLPIHAVKPRALPFEPLQLGRRLNFRLFFGSVLREVEEWLGKDRFILAIGKPSPLAIAVIDRYAGDTRCAGTVYDRMDRFAAFHRGVSARAMQRWEDEIVRKVDRVQVASSSLRAELAGVRPEAELCLNGFDEESVRDALARDLPAGGPAVGYIGTLGAWFDWDWVLRLAAQLEASRSELGIRLIGPLYYRPHGPIPPRIAIEPALPHRQALQAMRGFKVGLIPFKVGRLTEGVDAIKYYEYRALGLPVVGTPFGELRHKTSDPGLFLSDVDDPLAAVGAALALEEARARVSLAGCTWTARFAPLLDWVNARRQR